MKLRRRYVEKPWGRTELPPSFDPPAGKRIGEVWFTNGADLPLLAKYIFTGERLSIQVHPDDEQARARGFPQGKSECWYILDAGAGATVGLGLKREVSSEELRAAALDGSIEDLLDWRPARAGDFFLVPAGTIHALGGGLSLLEFQQNSDISYRLYDYDRARSLHVEEAVAVGRRASYPTGLARLVARGEEHVLVDGPYFTFVHAFEDVLQGRRRWVIPLDGKVWSGGESAGPGECLLVEPDELLDCAGARMLIGAKA
jgi:mannose-6-phosphate isomerase